MGAQASPHGYPHERASGPRRSRVGLWLGLVAALAPLALHRAYFSGEALLYWADATQLQFPRYVTLCNALQGGEFPLWQTLVYGGSPFHGNPENPTLYPPTLVLAALTTPIWTINLTILAHLSLAAVGMFALVVRLGRRMTLAEGPLVAGALVAAVIFSLNHFMRRDHVNLVTYGAAHAWIPWMLMAADGLLHGDRPRRSAGLLALCVAAIFATGGLYVIPYACLALALWMLLLGLGGDARTRARTLRLGFLAAVVALLLVSAKLLPYLEWVPTTNRTGRLPLEDALGTTLGEGEGGAAFVWSAVWLRTRHFGGVWMLLPALLALGLLRERVVRVALGLALLGFLLALGGWSWRGLYEFVPPFDRIRSAVRAWTLVNAFLPLLAGLGTAWLLSRSRALCARPSAAAALGVLLAAGLVAPLLDTDPRDGLLRSPERYSEILARTPLWPEAVERAGTRWRVGWPELAEPASHNEQFVTSALGAEIVAGYQGHVWPARQELFVYGPPDARIERAARLRRLAALSVKWLVDGEPAATPAGPPVVPVGLAGARVSENPGARARLVLPGVVVAVIDDDHGNLARRLLDHARFPIDQAAVISLPWSRDPAGERAGAAELAACDLVLVQAPVDAAEEFLPIAQHLRAPADLHTLGVHLDAQQLEAWFDALVDDVAQRAFARRSVELALEREGTARTLLHVLTVADVEPGRGRFAVVSEPWAWYPGWRIEGLPQEPVLRLAEGISTAFLLPAGSLPSPLVAVYAPRSFERGLWLGGLGLVLALALVLVPHRGAGRRGS